VAGIPNSDRLARWMSAALGSRHSFCVLPSVGHLRYHPDLEAAAKRHRGRLQLLRPVPGAPTRLAQGVLDLVLPNTWRSVWFKRVAQLLKPDLIHAIELQHAGYAWLGLLPRSMPFCVSAGGSDLSLFPGFEQHTEQIRSLLARADFFTADCAWHVAMARRLGFRGVTFPPVLNGCGVDLDGSRAHRVDPPSRRRTIAMRGDAGLSGRAHLALDALLPIRDLVARFDVRVYSAGEDVRLHAHVLCRDHGLRIECLHPEAPREEILGTLGAARATVAVSISNSASTALLESMALGALPIHSRSACAGEFVEHGVSALLVDPHRIASVTDALERALTDDALVDAAATFNWQTSQASLDERVQAAKIRSAYDEMEAFILKRRAERQPIRPSLTVEP
jgi:glycosyltransferase involved in cell wall biosynthesis